jgi:hypothetical protein
MNKKVVYGFCVFLLTLSLISAATTTGKLGVNTGGAQIVSSCEDWGGSGWGSCINGIQTFICFNKNNYLPQCNTINLRPANCGITQTCSVTTTTSTTSSSGGGGGGGSSGGSSGSSNSGGSNNAVALSTSGSSGSCIENWQCSNWSNGDDQCGKRTCEDLNKCGTENLKPVVLKTCSSTGFFGITGGVIGSIGDFVQTGKGIAISLVFIAIIIAGAVILIVRKGKAGKKKGATAEVSK